MARSKSSAAFTTFMGNSPVWYKQAVLFCLILNPILLLLTNETIVGWVILAEFIGTLALALRCYPLIPGGLVAIEAVFMGLATPHGIYHEVEANLEVILLLLFMVAGIHFMKDLLSWIFTKMIVSIKNKIVLSLTFAFVGAFLSAWLDALTVTAVMIAVAIAFYNVYTGATIDERAPDTTQSEDERKETARKDFEDFSGFLRNLLMHGVVGTAVGGMSTQVGEPQNLIIASQMNWSFIDFYLKMAHVSLPVLLFGLITTVLVEKFKIAGYGYQIPTNVRAILRKSAEKTEAEMDAKKRWIILMQGIGGIWLIVALALHLAEVGLIGLSVIIFLTAVTGKTNENTIGYAFEEATPFTSLLVVFFVIVAMIEHTHLFAPVINIALQADPTSQPYSFFIFSGVLSAISDNVFVGTIYIKEAVEGFVTPENLQMTKEAFKDYQALWVEYTNLVPEEVQMSKTLFETLPQEKLRMILLKIKSPEIHTQLENIAISINVGTNVPSIATPNGQAAFLFLLTNAVAARIKLSYIRMVIMALPYFFILTVVCLVFLVWDWVHF